MSQDNFCSKFAGTLVNRHLPYCIRARPSLQQSEFTDHLLPVSTHDNSFEIDEENEGDGVGAQRLKRLTLVPWELKSRFSTRQLVFKLSKNATEFLNLNQVADDLHVPARFLLAFYGYSLQVSFSYSEKTHSASLSGCHEDAQQLSWIFVDFIDQFLLCACCGNPSVHHTLSGASVMMQCLNSHCGSYKPVVSKVPGFLTYVATECLSAINRGDSSGSSSFRNSSGGDSIGSVSDSSSHHHRCVRFDCSTVFQTPKNATTIPNEPSMSPAEQEWLDKRLQTAQTTDWSVDVSPEAQQRRQRELFGSEINPVTINNNVASIFEQGASLSCSDDLVSLFEQLQSIQQSQPELFLKAFSDALVLESINHFAAENPRASSVISPFGQGALKHLFNECDHYLQMDLLRALQTSVSSFGGFALTRFSSLCQFLYMQDIIDEDIFLDWYGVEQKGSDNHQLAVSVDTISPCVNASYIFIHWLRTAEDESDDENEEESEDTAN